MPLRRPNLSSARLRADKPPAHGGSSHTTTQARQVSDLTTSPRQWHTARGGRDGTQDTRRGGGLRARHPCAYRRVPLQTSAQRHALLSPRCGVAPPLPSSLPRRLAPAPPRTIKYRCRSPAVVAPLAAAAPRPTTTTPPRDVACVASVLTSHESRGVDACVKPSWSRRARSAVSTVAPRRARLRNERPHASRKMM